MLLGGDDGGAVAADTEPLSSGEVRAVVDAFADAYETEDGRALGQLLTNDVERVLPSGVLRSRKAVVRAYEGQFRANEPRATTSTTSTSAAGPPAARAATIACAGRGARRWTAASCSRSCATAGARGSR